MTTELAGTMILPGVSRNGRLYTPEAIAKAFARLEARIADPDGLSVTMLTHHGAGDDSTRIVAQVHEVKLNADTGGIEYRAHPADTAAAATILKLVEDTEGGKPILGNVSIRGYWMDNPTKVVYQGQTVETADDIEIDGLDLTKDPGVLGATVRAVAAASTAAAESGATETRVAIVETTAPVRVTITETVAQGAVYADTGYLGGAKRFRVDTVEHARTSSTRLDEESDVYTPKQLKRIRHRIDTALATFGETMTATVTATTDETRERKPFAETRVGDIVECYDDYLGGAGFSVQLYNGPLTVSVSAYYGLDPADLASIASKAMDAAVMAAKAIDAEVDEADPIETTTRTPDAAPAVTETSAPTRQEAAPVGDQTSTTTPAAPTATTETAAPAAEVTETATPSIAEQVAAGIAAGLKAAGVTPVATTETAPPTEVVAETRTKAEIDAEIASGIAEGVAAQTAALVEAARLDPSLVKRKGLVEKLAEDAPPVELHKLSDEELRERAARVWDVAMPQHGGSAV